MELDVNRMSRTPAQHRHDEISIVTLVNECCYFVIIASDTQLLMSSCDSANLVTWQLCVAFALLLELFLLYTFVVIVNTEP